MSLPKAVLILYPDKFVEEEAIALAEAAGYKPVGTLSQSYLSRAKYGVGEGKAAAAAELVRETDADTLIFDARLNASQMYNLAKLCRVEVKDREKLILEIFAKRASTAEAKLQVQLAELSYELPRAREKVRMAKRGEQPGFFGLGKYEVDVYLRMMKRRMATLQRKVQEVRARREIFRKAREKTGFPTIAITGYTGAGKTTLFNRLTGESKETNAGVFTTLSTTTRAITVAGKKMLLSDTVGFISRLPPYLIEAFKSTLEEVSYATLVVLLIDSSQPEQKLVNSYQSCVETLAELGVTDERTLVVLNKVDLIGDEELGEKIWRLGLNSTVAVSALAGMGVEELLQTMSERIRREAGGSPLGDRS